MPHPEMSTFNSKLNHRHCPALPDSWHYPVETAFAVLDIARTLFAKEWADRGHVILMIGGLLSFSVLLITYARFLAVADRSIVTLGWVVFLQIGMRAVDRLCYGVTLPWNKRE